MSVDSVAPLDAGVRTDNDKAIGAEEGVDLDLIVTEIVIGNLGLVQKAEASREVIGDWVVLRRGDWSSILKESDSVDLTTVHRLCIEGTTEEEFECASLIFGIDSGPIDGEARVWQLDLGCVNHDKFAVVDKIVVLQDPLLLELGSFVCDLSSEKISIHHVSS